MWRHLTSERLRELVSYDEKNCKPQQGWLLVGRGEPCNWCDCKERKQ